MKSNQPVQIVILSGKGGTGKTSLTGAFAHLLSNSKNTQKAILVDADVDAANLSLLVKPDQSVEKEYWGGFLANIDPALCSGCGQCQTVCRFDAVFPHPDHAGKYWIDPIACDGCAACKTVCPEAAITMERQQEGVWFESTTGFGTLFHAELFPGRENSGKLVTLLRHKARLLAEDTRTPLIIIDGPPGIGCPVISACTGVDYGVLVTEPGLAGLLDLKRIWATLQHFHIPSGICINKADIYEKGRNEILEFAAQENISILGEIPFDEHIPLSISQGLPVTHAFPGSPAAEAIQKIWEASIQQAGAYKGEEIP